MSASPAGGDRVPSIKLQARVSRSRKNISGGLVRAETLRTSISQDALSASAPARLRSCRSSWNQPIGGR